MIGARLGHFLDRPFYPLVKKMRPSPNAFTVTGFLITAAASVVLAVNLRAGAVLVLIGGIFDILDGTVARTNGKVTKFGAYLDSVLDRLSDAFLFIAVAWNLRAVPTGVLLSLLSMVGAFLVSYARARAEGLGVECKTGIMERPERVVLLCFGALTGWIIPSLWVLSILTAVTVFQRVYLVWKAMGTDK